MALGFKGTIAAELLDALFNANAYTGPAAIYMQLHTGEPGAGGTFNVATNTTRRPVTFAVASGGQVLNDADVQWLNVPATEDYTHGSLWDALSGGNFLAAGLITASGVTAGDTFTLETGNVAVSLALAG